MVFHTTEHSCVTAPKRGFVLLPALLFIAGLLTMPVGFARTNTEQLASVTVAIVPATNLNLVQMLPVAAILPTLPKILTAPEIPVAEETIEKTDGTHLKISSIGVDAAIKDMGLTTVGAMAVPDNRTDVGWYSLGVRPGEIGSAVIGAHSRFASAPGVFAHLDQLQKGDVVSVVDTEGKETTFVVRDMRTYAAIDTDTGIFTSESGAHLNLITCSGAWNPLTETYATRLVVFTDMVSTTSNLAVVSL